MNKLLFIFTIMFITSCNHKKFPMNEFENVKNIKSTKLLEDEFVFIGSNMLFLKKDSSLIFQNFNGDSLVTKVNMYNKKVSHFIPIGNGVNEFVNINVTQTKTDSTFLFQDMNSANIYHMNAISGEIIDFFNYGNYRCMNVLNMNNHYISTGLFKEGMFAIWNNDVFLNYVYKYPKDNFDDDKMLYKAMAYQVKIVVNERLNRILFCSSKFSYFEIFQLFDGDLQSIKKEYRGKYKYDISNDENFVYAHPFEDNIEGFIDACSTDEYIYILYSGRSIEDPAINTHEQACLSNQILVYDWDGNPIVKYTSDIDLKYICVNDNGKIIYSIAYDPDPVLVYFYL